MREKSLNVGAVYFPGHRHRHMRHHAVSTQGACLCLQSGLFIHPRIRSLFPLLPFLISSIIQYLSTQLALINHSSCCQHLHFLYSKTQFIKLKFKTQYMLELVCSAKIITVIIRVVFLQCKVIKLTVHLTCNHVLEQRNCSILSNISTGCSPMVIMPCI